MIFICLISNSMNILWIVIRFEGIEMDEAKCSEQSDKSEQEKDTN